MVELVITLAIETATTACSIALRTASGEVHERLLDTQRRHTEVLTAGINDALSEFQLSVRDLTAIVVDRGPGLFTGLRVGLATARGLADALGVPLLGVTSLEILAHEAAPTSSTEQILALVDGRRGEVFAQTFRSSTSLLALSPAEVRTPQDVVIEWGTSGLPVTVVGDGAQRYRELFGLLPNISIVDIVHPSPATALRLLDLVATGDVSPLYLREADAVANFSTRGGVA